MKEFSSTIQSWMWRGLILTPLRVCTGWLIFSAFWRRIVLKPEALDPLSSLYEGIKFNHFIPSSLGLTPLIKYLVLHPQILFIFLWVFTIAEGVIGLGLLFGLFTRLVSLLSFCLLMGIMLGAGWLGTTCVDEWQIGVFGIAASSVLFLGGGGVFSLDRLLNSCHSFQRRFWNFWMSGPLFLRNEERKTYWSALLLSFFTLLFTLVTNQLNVGGVWGPFKNKAVKPHLTLSKIALNKNGDLRFDVFRDAGPDTYGSFVVSVQVVNEEGKRVLDFDSAYLGSLSPDHIHNHYLEKVHPNGISLVTPLGALASIELSPLTPQHVPPGKYFIEVTDIDQSTWKAAVLLE